MNVHIVYENIKFRNSIVRGIFSTTDKAYNYAEELNEKYGDDYTNFSVETYGLDDRH